MDQLVMLWCQTGEQSALGTELIQTFVEGPMRSAVSAFSKLSELMFTCYGEWYFNMKEVLWHAILSTAVGPSMLSS